MRKLTLAAALLAAAAFANPAQAGHYVFHYDAYADWSDPDGPASATIHLTTSDTLNALGGYDILSASGTIDGNAVTGLVANPNQPDQYGDGLYIIDNVLFASGPALDAPGFAVVTALGEYNFGYDIDDFSGDPAYPYYGIFADGSTHISPRTGLPVTNYHVSVGTASLAAVPEPASWAMMVAGFGLAGAAMRRRRAAVRFA